MHDGYKGVAKRTLPDDESKTESKVSSGILRTPWRILLVLAKLQLPDSPVLLGYHRRCRRIPDALADAIPQLTLPTNS